MSKNLDVERVAETHFLIRPVLFRALQQQKITPEGRQRFTVAANNYAELWHNTFGDRWFDMGSMVRLGTAIETGLRDRYATAAGGLAGVDRGIFQRLVRPADLERVFRTACGEDLTSRAEWNTMREVMLHRHLYAHRSGVVDEQYLSDHLFITGIDVRPNVATLGYPNEEVYWFTPLGELTRYINEARAFFRSFP